MHFLCFRFHYIEFMKNFAKKRKHHRMKRIIPGDLGRVVELTDAGQGRGIEGDWTATKSGQYFLQMQYKIYMVRKKPPTLDSSSSFGCSHQRSTQQIFRVHFVLSSASSSVNSTTAMSSLTESINLLQDHPLFLFPGSSILSILLPIYPSYFLRIIMAEMALV